MAPRNNKLKTYVNKNASGISRSVDVFNALFADNLRKRLAGKPRKKKLEIKELPPRVETPPLLEDSIHISTENTFDKIVKGTVYNKVNFKDNVKVYSSDSDVSRSNIHVSTTFHSPLLTRQLRKRKPVQYKASTRQRSSKDNVNHLQDTTIETISQSLEIEKIRNVPDQSSSYIVLPKQRKPETNKQNISKVDASVKECYSLSIVTDDIGPPNNNSKLYITTDPVFSKTFLEAQFVHSSTPCVTTGTKKLVATPLSPISAKLLEESYKKIQEWENKIPEPEIFQTSSSDAEYPVKKNLIVKAKHKLSKNNKRKVRKLSVDPKFCLGLLNDSIFRGFENNEKIISIKKNVQLDDIVDELEEKVDSSLSNQSLNNNDLVHSTPLKRFSSQKQFTPKSTKSPIFKTIAKSSSRRRVSYITLRKRKIYSDSFNENKNRSKKFKSNISNLLLEVSKNKTESILIDNVSNNDYTHNSLVNDLDAFNKFESKYNKISESSNLLSKSRTISLDAFNDFENKTWASILANCVSHENTKIYSVNKDDFYNSHLVSHLQCLQAQESMKKVLKNESQNEGFVQSSMKTPAFVTKRRALPKKTDFNSYLGVNEMDLPHNSFSSEYSLLDLQNTSEIINKPKNLLTKDSTYSMPTESIVSEHSYSKNFTEGTPCEITVDLTEEDETESSHELKSLVVNITNLPLENVINKSEETSAKQSYLCSEEDSSLKLKSLVLNLTNLPLQNLKNKSEDGGALENASCNIFEDQSNACPENSSNKCNSTENTVDLTGNDDSTETEPSIKLQSLVLNITNLPLQSDESKSNNTNSSNTQLYDTTSEETRDNTNVSTNSHEICQQNCSDSDVTHTDLGANTKLKSLVLNLTNLPVSIQAHTQVSETLDKKNSTCTIDLTDNDETEASIKIKSLIVDLTQLPLEENNEESTNCNVNENSAISVQPEDLISDSFSVDKLCNGKLSKNTQICHIDTSNLSDIIESSVENIEKTLEKKTKQIDPDGFAVPNFKAPFRKTTVLKPGKLWRRSLMTYRRSSTVIEVNESICRKDADLYCECQKCKTLQQEKNTSRHSRFSIRVVPISPYKSVSKNSSILENYAHSSGYVSLPGQDIDDNLECFKRLSLRDKKKKLSLIHNPTTPVTAREIVLRRCGQTEPLQFEKCYPASILQNCQKIGEGVYGEVFLYRNQNGGTSVMKIIPIEGDLIVNGERQKKYEEIISEIIIAMELSNLRNNKNNSTNGFSEVQKIRCVQGCYPNKLLDLWDLFDETRGSENDSPAIFTKNQLYIVLELANGGRDLESFVFNNAVQAYTMFKQVACSLAVAENELQFEHRDLHWGNILLTTVDKHKKISYKLDGKSIEVPTQGVEVAIIDFTLSRIEYDGVVIFNDLSQDPDLFTAEGDYQFEIYRLMQKKNGNSWQHFEPYTNILWLHYTLDKAITALRYKNKQSKMHKNYISKLQLFKEEVLNYDSVKEFVLDMF